MNLQKSEGKTKIFHFLTRLAGDKIAKAGICRQIALTPIRRSNQKCIKFTLNIAIRRKTSSCVQQGIKKWKTQIILTLIDKSYESKKNAHL